MYAVFESIYPPMWRVIRAATLTLASGAAIENVAKMLGHSDTKMTRHYARILDASIMRDMQLVAKNIAQ